MRAAGGHRRYWVAAGLTASALGLFAAAGVLARHSTSPSRYEREPAAEGPALEPVADPSMDTEPVLLLDVLRTATPPAASPWHPTPVPRPGAQEDAAPP